MTLLIILWLVLIPKTWGELRIRTRLRQPGLGTVSLCGPLNVEPGHLEAAHQAADHEDIEDSGRTSFANALYTSRRSVRWRPDSGHPLATAIRLAITETLHRLVSARRFRLNARVVRFKMSGFNVKRAAQRDCPQPWLPQSGSDP